MVIRDIRQDTSDFVLLSDMVPHIIQRKILSKSP